VKNFQNGNNNNNNNNNNNRGIFFRNNPFFLLPIFEKKTEKKSLHLDFDFSLEAF